MEKLKEYFGMWATKDGNGSRNKIIR